ncbi:MAG TPA: cobalamin-binding protein [Steroidobacteraceae bacterium]
MAFLPALCVLWAGMANSADSTVAKPLRIVSLAPNLTELTFSAGAGAQIVGTVEYSDYPQAARSIPRIGDAFRIDFERVLALRPDVVLAWESGTPQNVIDRLRALQLNVRVLATYRIADIGAATREIGVIGGTTPIAEQAAKQFDNDIEVLRRQYSARPAISVFLQINDRPVFTVNGKQIMSQAIALCGGRNVFGELNDLAPEVGEEAVLAADPQVIIATDNSGHDALDHWRHWQSMSAVRSGNLYVLPPDDLARPTIRLARGAAEICRTLETARAKTKPAGDGR